MDSEVYFKVIVDFFTVLHIYYFQANSKFVLRMLITLCVICVKQVIIL